MIVLTAEIEIKGENPSPFRIGESKLGDFLLGKNVNTIQHIDKRNILSYESEIKDRDDIKKPSFGLISNGGRISFNDKNQKFLNNYNHGFVNKQCKVYIYINNTVSKQSQKLGTYYIDAVDYDVENNVVNITVTDGLTRYQEINVDKIVFFEDVGAQEIWQKISEKMGFNETDFDAYWVNIKYANIEGGTLWSQATKLASASYGIGYVDENGKLILKSNV